MAEAPNQTRREIERTRLRIAKAAGELEERINEARDWRIFVGNYPIESAAITLAIGFVLGSGLLFRSLSRQSSSKQMMRSQKVNGLMFWLRPIITPVLTARVLDYLRKRSQ